MKITYIARNVNLKDNFKERVEKKLGKDYTDWLKKNSLDIYRDKLFDIPVVHKPKKFLGRWR